MFILILFRIDINNLYFYENCIMPLPRIIVDNRIDAAVANIEELELDLSFNDFSPNANFVEDFSPEFICSGDKNDATNYIDLWSSNGRFGEKIPCRIEFDNFFTVNGFLDLGSEESVYSTNPKIYKVKFESSQRAFFDLGKTPLTRFVDDSCIVNTRYVRRGIPDYLESALIYITIFLVVKEVINSVQRTIQIIKDATPRSITDAGLAVVLAFNILLEIIYIVSLLLALNALLKDLSENLFAKPRKFKALDVYSVIEKGCNFLGYEFNSEILKNRFANLTYALSFPLGLEDNEPVPLAQITKTPKNNPIPNITLLEFIEKFTPLFRGKLRVTSDNKVQIESQQFYESRPTNIRLNDLYRNGDKVYKYKSVPQFIEYKYLTSNENQHIKQNQAVLIYELKNTSPNITNSNSIRVDLSYSVAQRKNSQDSLEKLWNGVFDLFFGLNSNYKVSGGERIGFALLNSDILPTDMIYIRDGEKIDSKTYNILNAETRIIESYSIDGLDQNQWVEISNRDKEPLCNQANVGDILNNNVCYDTNGNQIIIQRNIKDPKSGLYDVSYMRRVKAGEFGYIDPKNIEVTLISNINGVNNTETF